MLYWTLVAVCGLVLASVADAACDVPAMDTCKKCGDAIGCNPCAVGPSHFLCVDNRCPTGLAISPDTCTDEKPSVAVVTTALGCLGNAQKKLCKTQDPASHLCIDTLSTTLCSTIAETKLIDPTKCASPDNQKTCAKCGEAWCLTCLLTGSNNAKKGYLCTDAATCPVGTVAADCNGVNTLVVASSGDCGAGTTTCMKATKVYCVAEAEAKCADYGLDAPKCPVAGATKCSECKTSNGCKACKIGTTDYLCATACPTGLATEVGTCTDSMLLGVKVTSLLECTGAAKTLCKIKDATEHVCLTKPSDTVCTEVNGGLLEAPTASCASPETQAACAKCGEAWCTTCALGADDNKKGYLCNKEGKCPVGSVATTCTGLDKQVITVADGGKCEATATTCTKANAKYCIVGVTDAKCAEFGLDVSTDEGGNGGGDKDGDCKGQACKACVDNAKCSACIKDTMSVCITKGGACPDIANQTATAGVSCDKVTGTIVEGTCETPNHKCKKGNGDVCIVEECKAAGLDSNAAPPAMATLVGLAIAIVAMHC